jgi:hypothetical protein
MESSEARQAYLREIVLVTATARFPLGGDPIKTWASDLPAPGRTAPDDEPRPPRRLTLAGEAMRWTYVLRSRERWKGDERALAQQQRAATETLYAFGLGEDALKSIAQAGEVMVQMPYRGEAHGWAGRVFPWEFVLASATRRHRNGKRLTVLRHLQVDSLKVGPVGAPQPKVLFVQSRPGAIGAAYDFEDEARRVRTALGLREGSPQWKALNSPTLAELRQNVSSFRPEIVHLAGCDNHQGVRLVRDLGGARTRVWYGEGDGFEASMYASDFLEAPDHAIDGYLLRHEGGAVRVTSPEELGEALTAERSHQPFLVSLNLWNSAARTSPLLLAHGALAAIGFQDAFDDSLSEYFYEAFYTALRSDWNVPGAFQQAWGSLRAQPDLGPGTGIVLWGRAPLIGKPARAAAPLPPPPPVAAPTPVVECRIEPKKELNYSVLHNHGPLFDKFELHTSRPEDKPVVHVLVELHCGSEQARYAAALTMTREREPLMDRVRIPLTATLMRSVSEAVQSSLFVHVTHDNKTVLKDTYPLRLLPVDQWLDNARSGQWLPSFVLPRDPAVQAAITAAQRYVRVIRDDPTAGFEGYQAASADDPESLEQVDLQVEALWAALLHDWKLGYINPPPTYADTDDGVMPLDSQRLRTPSEIRRAQMGTCIDLALLFAACLELVDIYPVIFLLEGHALPGYWRHHEFQAQYRDVLDPGDGESEAVADGDERRNSAPGAQMVPWKVGKSGYRELRKQIRLGRLVPLETVRLTEHGSFREAIRAGAEALAVEADFDSVLDIIIARRPHNVTPLPILEGQP